MVPQWIIEKKRDGQTLSADEIRVFVDGYTTGDIPDYQMAALAMAIYLRGMTFDEIAALTDAMMHSGKVLDFTSIPAIKADKHSTGGIGDKVSLILAPLVACHGVVDPMISGRGLGITGGTLDKLQSIPGYRTDLDVPEFTGILRDVGCSIIGQTADLAPADRKLYALRDVTATVPSIPLIAASIMCKKLASGTDCLVLDVKHGAGAFMKNADDARALARTMVAVGQRMGRRVSALLTDMNQPLGRTAGNALEVVESIDALRGHGPADLMEVTYALGIEMLRLAGRTDTPSALRAALANSIADGSALTRFRRMVERHGGDVRAVDDPARLPLARLREPVRANRAGYVARADADALGRACLLLGAGRTRVTDTVDHAVGLADLVKVGDRVDAGAPLCVVHANDEARLAQAQPLLARAFVVSDTPVAPTTLVTGHVNMEEHP